MVYREHSFGIASGLAVAIVLFLAASTARAVDGVVEINQAKALAGGVTATDTAGFPVTINTGGSYRLTGQLVVPDVNTTAIEVSGLEPVTIDLNGFAIVGPANCLGQPVFGFFSCTATGTGKGIDASGFYLRVRNGTIRGMGAAGLEAGGFARVERVRAFGNGGYGINAGGSALIVANIVHENGSGGIYASANTNLVRDNLVERNNGVGIFAQRSIVSGNTSSENLLEGITLNGEGTLQDNNVLFNGGDGIRTTGGLATIVSNAVTSNRGVGIKVMGVGSTVRGNEVSGSSSAGIETSDGSTLEGNTTFLNGGDGITTGQGSTVSNNTCRNNASDGIFANGGSNVYGNTTYSNTGHGISVNGPSRVFGNASSNNTRAGLRLQSNVGYAENVMAGNGEGNVQSGTAMGTNFCETNTTCP